MTRAKAKKARPRPKEPKAPREARRWRVGLEGGVIVLGDDSFELVVLGELYVMGKSAKDAQELAGKILTQMQERGTLLPDDGLELEVKDARAVGPGDVARLQRFLDENASGEDEA